MSDHRARSQAECFTCEIVDEYVTLANGFTQDLSSLLVSPMWTLFLSLAGIWIIVWGYKIILGHGNIAEFGKEFVFVIIASILLSGQGPELVNTIYSASLDIMGSAASVALAVGQKGGAGDPTGGLAGMPALVKMAEDGVREVFGMAGQIASQGSMMNTLPYIYALALIIPYFLLLVVFFSQVVVSIFRIMMLATFSPYLMLAFAFGWGRGMAMKAISTLLAAFMVLFAASAAVAVVMYGVQSLSVGQPGTIDLQDLSVTSAKLLLAMALGWMGTAFLTEATGLANSITSSALTNNAAAVITAGAAGTAMGLAKAGVKLAPAAAGGPAGMAVGWAAGKAMDGAGATAEAAGYGAGATADYVNRRAAELIHKAKTINDRPDN